MRILGVDPGIAVTGYGVVDGGAGTFQHILSGTIRTAAVGRGPARLKKIHDDLLQIIDSCAPAAMSLERQFVAINVQSAFRLGEARAAAMLAAAERKLDFFEYAPNQVKLAVAAFGHADKAQVKSMIRKTLRLGDESPLADDAADALALAICHLSSTRLGRLEQIVGRNAPRRWRRA